MKAQLLANSSCVSSESSRALSSSQGPTEGRACLRTTVKFWFPVQKLGGSRCALLLSCRETRWLLPRNKGKSVTELCQGEETSRGAGDKGGWRANMFTSCCTLEEVQGWLVFFVWKKASFGQTEQAVICSGQFQSHQEATLSIPAPTQYPTKARLLNCSVSQNFDLYIKTNWFRKERPGVPSIFSLTALLQFLSPNLLLGWKVSRFPVALQIYVCLWSCFLLAPGKIVLCVWSGKGMQQNLRELVPPSGRGDVWDELVVWNCTEIELLCWA